MSVALGAVLASTSEPDLSEAFGEGLTTRDWVIAAVVLLSAVVVGRVLQAVIQRIMTSDDTDVAVSHFAAVGTRNLVILAGVIYSLGALDVRLGPLLGAIGLGGLALAFAAQSILASFFASIILRTRRPFRRGEQVVLGEIEGTVEEVNFRTVTLRSFDGERAIVPCDMVLSNPIINLTVRGRRRSTFEVQVAYETDLVEAMEVLEDAVTQVDGVLAEPRMRAYVQEMADSGVTLALLYWHAPEMMAMWQVRSDVGAAAHRALVRNGIEIPFPQRVVRFRNDEEARAEVPDVGAGAARAGRSARAGADPNRDTRDTRDMRDKRDDDGGDGGNGGD